MDILIILNDSNSRTKYTFSSMFYFLCPSSIFYSFQALDLLGYIYFQVFYFFNIIVNGIVSLIYMSHSLLLMYRK